MFEVVQDVAKARPVTTGQTRQNDVTITKGLGGGEVLVNRPPDALERRRPRAHQAVAAASRESSRFDRPERPERPI